MQQFRAYVTARRASGFTWRSLHPHNLLRLVHIAMQPLITVFSHGLGSLSSMKCDSVYITFYCRRCSSSEITADLPTLAVVTGGFGSWTRLPAMMQPLAWCGLVCRRRLQKSLLARYEKKCSARLIHRHTDHHCANSARKLRVVLLVVAETTSDRSW